MTVARASTTLGRTVLRRTPAQTRVQTWRQLGRRGYASAEHAKKSSDLPWLIGSVVATVPAAVWLIGQAPKKSDHHGPSHGKEEEPAEEQSEEQQEEEKPSEDDSSDDAKTEKTEDSEDESKDEQKDDGKEEAESKDDKQDESKEDDSKDEGKEDKKDEEGKDDKEDSSDSNKDEHGYEKPGPNAPGQINWKPSLGKGPGEGQKVGERKPTEKKGEKDAHSDYSGAKNPYLDDDEKSKKGEGMKETMKIHGTVDSRRPARGDGKSNE